MLVSLFGALPFFISGEIPNFADALFESVAGFTTTGTFALSDLELWSRSMLFWRNFAQWLGGIGVLAFVLAIVRSKAGGSGFALHLFQAESPGPRAGKVVA
ncbi:MAG: potassium transporter TrkG, partial [Porticoccaceae bacterium]